MSMVERLIDAEPQKCTGCLSCKLASSFQHTGTFNLNQAYIVIVEDNEGITDITFTKDCDKCGVCVHYCVYEALKLRRER